VRHPDDPSNPLGVVLWKCGGPRYRTRDGRKAVVTESNVIAATGTLIWQGSVWDPTWRRGYGLERCEWHRDGRHLGGDAGLDLVGVEPPGPDAVG